MSQVDTDDFWTRLHRSLIILALSSALATPATAQERDRGKEHGHQQPHTHATGDAEHHEGLHFTHPLIAESVSPESKVRLDYSFRDAGEEDESEIELEGEYAFHRAFAIEVGTHFDPFASELGETHAIAKFANYAFEEQGLLLGYGLEVGLPTGAGHGHGGVAEHEHAEGEEHEHPEPDPESIEVDDDVYEFSPFLNAGLMAGAWELVGWTLYTIPTNQSDPARVSPQLRYSLSALLHATDRIEPLVELNGTVGLGGPQAERETLTLSPGLRLRPLEDHPLVVGGGVSLPVTDDRDFDTRVLVSAFWHF